MRKRCSIKALIAQIGRTIPDRRQQISCRDEEGRPALLEVRPADDGVVLVLQGHGSVTLRPLDVGRLRIALRDAIAEYSELRSSIPSVVQHQSAAEAGRYGH